MKRTLKAALSLFRIRAAEGLQYRVAAFSGAAVSAFWALIEVVVITVFFQYGHNTGGSINGQIHINGLTLSQGISYIWLGQLMVWLQTPAVDSDLMKKITSGDIGIELCRPLDFYWHWFARSTAGRISTFILRGGMVIACGTVLSLIGFRSIGFGLPFSMLNFSLFLLSLFGAFLFSAAYGMFITSIRMGIAWGDGPINMVVVSGMILAGGYLPLQLWPDFMQDFLRIQPFASYLDTPARLYTGSVSIENGLRSILIQFLWIIAFIISGRIIMKRRLRNVVVQGG